MIALYLILWYVSGIASFIYWYTKNFDFKIKDIPAVSFLSVLGPIGFLVGWITVGDWFSEDRVLFKKRNNDNTSKD